MCRDPYSEFLCDGAGVCAGPGVPLWAPGAHVPDASCGEILDVGEHSYWIQ